MTHESAPGLWGQVGLVQDFVGVHLNEDQMVSDFDWAPCDRAEMLPGILEALRDLSAKLQNFLGALQCEGNMVLDFL